MCSILQICSTSLPACLSGRDLVTVLQGTGNPRAKTSAQECAMGSHSKESGWEMGEAAARAVPDVRSLPGQLIRALDGAQGETTPTAPPTTGRNKQDMAVGLS